MCLSSKEKPSIINVSKSLPIDMNSDLSSRFDEEKLPSKVKELYFKTYKHKGFTSALENLRETFAMSGLDSTGFLLIGGPGVGKSRFLRYFTTEIYSLERYQPTDVLTPLPILSIRVPGKPTINRVLEKLLECAGHLAPVAIPAESAVTRLNRMIKHLKVEMIIFDEFQHLLRRNATIRTSDVMKFLKVLMDEHRLAIVFAGHPESLELLAEHPDVKQRFEFAQSELVPFNLKAAGNGNVQEFARYLANLQDNFRGSGIDICDLITPDMITRIYVATLGLPRRISQLFNRLMLRCHDKEMITVNELEHIFNAMPFNKIKPFKLFTVAPHILNEKFEYLVNIQSEQPVEKASKHKAGTRQASKR
jgi:hypothetical protein